MARVRIKFPANTFKKQFKKIKRELRNEGLLKQISDDMISDMKKGVDPKTGKSFKGLASSTIERRRRLAKFNKTDKAFSPARSNLTFTGNFLNSIKADVTKSSNGARIVIEPTGVHPGYKLVKGGRSDAVPNELIAFAQEEMGRNVLTISKKRIKAIAKMVNEFIRKKLS